MVGTLLSVNVGLPRDVSCAVFGDDELCIGDCSRLGTATFEVTVPRVTDNRVGIRMNDPRASPRCWSRRSWSCNPRRGRNSSVACERLVVYLTR
jgi:hypothetical protein